MLGDPSVELAAHHGAALAGDLFTLMKDHERGNAADAEARAQPLLRLGIDLGQAHARLEPGRRPVEIRRHHLAGTAPGGPEIDGERNVGLRGVALETRFGQRHGMSLEQELTAMAAFAVASEARCRHGVLGVAGRTNDNQFLVSTHLLPPSTMKFCAVTIRLSSAESHSTMRAMSGGWSFSLRHCAAIRLASAAGVSHSAICRSVMIQPGMTELRRMPSLPRSRA